MSFMRELRCVLSRPFGHQWVDAPGRWVKPHGAVQSVRLGPLRVCSSCGAEDWGNPEQSVGG